MPEIIKKMMLHKGYSHAFGLDKSFKVANPEFDWSHDEIVRIDYDPKKDHIIIKRRL